MLLCRYETIMAWKFSCIFKLIKKYCDVCILFFFFAKHWIYHNKINRIYFIWCIRKALTSDCFTTFCRLAHLCRLIMDFFFWLMKFRIIYLCDKFCLLMTHSLYVLIFYRDINFTVKESNLIIESHVIALFRHMCQNMNLGPLT